MDSSATDHGNGGAMTERFPYELRLPLAYG